MHADLCGWKGRTPPIQQGPRQSRSAEGDRVAMACLLHFLFAEYTGLTFQSTRIRFRTLFLEHCF